jgi:hypothetical protein
MEVLQSLEKPDKWHHDDAGVPDHYARSPAEAQRSDDDGPESGVFIPSFGNT